MMTQPDATRPYDLDTSAAVRELDAIRRALIATRATVDPASASAADLDELIRLAAVVQDEAEVGARVDDLIGAVLTSAERDFAHG